MNVKGSLSQLAAIQGHQITEKDLDIFLEARFTTLVITGDSDLVRLPLTLTFPLSSLLTSPLPLLLIPYFQMVPHKHSLNIKSLLRHKAELVVIEGAGHGVLEEAKHEVC